MHTETANVQFNYFSHVPDDAVFDKDEIGCKEEPVSLEKILNRLSFLVQKACLNAKDRISMERILVLSVKVVAVSKF